MRIKTITCHNVYNYGASLQAYALMKYLQNRKHDVEIIDYRPDYLCTRYSFWHVDKTAKFKGLCDRNKIFHLLYALKNYYNKLIMIGRKKPFDRFRKYFLKVTDRKYKTNEELKEHLPSADVFIVGSDQVWNSDMKNGRDPAFYLDFVPDEITRVAYAASFGTGSIEKGYETFVRNMVRRLDYTSVREKTGLKILKSIGINEGVCVVDPIFLLGKQEWEALVEKEHKEKYLLVYDFVYDSALEETAKAIAEARGWKIYSINDYRNVPYADKNISNAGPKQFLELIHSAQMIISNSLHGTAFSILFEKEFYAFRLKNFHTSPRIIDMLSTLGIPERCITTKESILGEEKIDYVRVKKLLNKNISYSYEYLRRVLNNEKQARVSK